MNHFTYRAGRLCAEDVDLATLAEDVGTPVYVYSTATLERHYRVFANAFPSDALIAYSVKANGNLAVLRTLARLGAGADVVSGGELHKALAAGIPAARIVFSGVGKTVAEMRLALEAGIHQFNVESEPESQSVSTPMSMPTPTPRSPPARRKPNSEYRGSARAQPTGSPPRCLISGPSVWMSILAARSRSSDRSKKRSGASPI
jgi:hypothetical protein